MPQVTLLVGRLVERSSGRDLTGGEDDMNDLPRFARAVDIPALDIFFPNDWVCSGLVEYGVFTAVALRNVGARERLGGVLPVEYGVTNDRKSVIPLHCKAFSRNPIQVLQRYSPGSEICVSLPHGPLLDPWEP